jgi:hypothetical protein
MLLAAALSGAAQAQSTLQEAPPEVLGPGAAAEGTDTEEPVETGEPPAPTSYNPSGAYTPSYERPVFPQWSSPVFVDQPGRTPDAPPSYIDRAYEARLRASFLSAQGLKGPLEGGWTLTDAGGAQLYDLQLVDSTGGTVDGAWRDLRRPGAIDASGLIVGASRIGAQLNLRFYSGAGGPVTATLTATGDGRWSGELTERGERRTVYLRRN